MSDIDTVWSNERADNGGDYALAGLDLQKGSDLMTAILISLFSDRQARASDDLPDGSTNRRGWWGTSGESVELGSRLWLLDRSKLTAEVGQQAQEYAAEGLQWMIDDGVVAGFEMSTEIRLPQTLILSIKAYRTLNGTTSKNYAWTWTGPAIYPPQPSGGGRSPLVTETGITLVTEDGTIITV